MTKTKRGTVELDPELLAKLSPQAVKLYLVLWAAADEYKRVSVSRTRMAERMGVKHKQSLAPYIRELQSVGVLLVGRHKNADGGYGANSYILTDLFEHHVPEGMSLTNELGPR